MEREPQIAALHRPAAHVHRVGSKRLWGRCRRVRTSGWANGGGRLAAAPLAVPALLRKACQSMVRPSAARNSARGSVRSPGQLLVQQAERLEPLQPTLPLCSSCNGSIIADAGRREEQPAQGGRATPPLGLLLGGER